MPPCCSWATPVCAGKKPQQPPATNYTPRTVKNYPATSTGRRLAFARWLTSRDNPLAARVAVALLALTAVAAGAALLVGGGA